jgi:hypothetical protein
MTTQILTFENREIVSPITPIYKYHVLESDDIDVEYMKYLEEYILSVEQDIIKSLPSSGDGYTELGEDSLTSRYASINFFKCEEFSYLKNYVKNLSITFLENIGHKNFNENIYGQCWANVMRPGQQIAQHKHSYGDRSFISGHVTVKHNGSHTYYHNPYDNTKYISQNSVGKLTLFPSWLEHGTSKVDDDIRITIAFDLRNQKFHELEAITNTTQSEHWVQI